MLETTRDALPSQPRELSLHDLDEVGARLRTQAPWHTHGSSSVTLVRQPDMRVVLVALRAGSRMQEHHTTARVTIQVHHGRVRLSVGGRELSLAAGQLLMLDRGVPHDVQADDDSALLLTLAWRLGTASDGGKRS